MVNANIQLETRPAYECFKIAEKAYFNAMQIEKDGSLDDRFYHCLTGITFAAFAFEAMINHYGRIYYADWNETERKKGNRKDRHKELFKKVGLTNYCENKEYEIVNKYVKIRDYFAHGKTKEEEISLRINNTTLDEELDDIFNIKGSDKIYKIINVEALEEFIETLKKIQNKIETTGKYPSGYRSVSGLAENGDRPLHEFPLQMSGTHTWSYPISS